jgi:phage terminase large subunit-like protein
MRSKINPRVLRYIEMVESGDVETCIEQKQLVAMVRQVFETEDIYTDDKQLEQYLDYQKYFPYVLFEWEVFCFALHNCTYHANDQPRWPDLFILVGRGSGKNGYLAFEDFCLLTPANGIRNYDIDICANAEEQAKTSFNDIYNVLENSEHRTKLSKHFYWNKEQIINLKTRSILKYRTNSPKSKDGMRSGKVDFDEVHEYEDYANIDVFTTGLGKKRHPRRTYITTNGNVRGGVLDDYLAKSEEILKGALPDGGFLPFICKLDDKEEAHVVAKWPKANPSLPYFPDLLGQMLREYEDFKRGNTITGGFMTKRMNFPEGNRDIEVTDWANILATKRDIPDLTGRSAVVGIDYAKVTDFASAVIHFRDGDMRYDIGHSWLCAQSADIPRMKCPWREWAARELLTVVDDVEINPDLIVEWIAEQGVKYNLVKLALDNFRYALLANSLKKIGFDAKEFKNVKLVRPSDIMIVSPSIDSCFAKQLFIWGDNPPMRWATNNTKMIRTGINKDTGNMTYGKIESKSRKTDPFMAVVAAMTIENELGDGGTSETPDVDVYIY